MPHALNLILRRAGGPLAIGLVAGITALLVHGPLLFWSLFVAVAAASALLCRSVRLASFSPPVKAPGARADAILPPLARAVFEQLPDPMMLLDGAGRVLFANRPMREVVGPGAEGKHVSAVLRNPPVLEAVARTSAGGEMASVEFNLPVPIERHYQAYTVRVNANPLAVALLLHNLTAIRRSEQMRADFVANASHELRTPLAAVSGFIDTLRGHAKDDEVAREQFLDIMSVEAARMRRLIDDLLSLTRIELNEHVPPEGQVDLGNIVREAAAALAPLADADQIVIVITGGENLPPVTGDRDELIQLFQNLIHNAIKYGRKDGHVWIALGQNDAMLWVSVRDDGEGIPQTSVARLTERFYRVDVKRSREKGGTGLGLAIVKHIVSRHRGRLQIESRLGEGSNFTVLLPPAAINPAKAEAAAPGTSPTANAADVDVTELL